jgi:hypothetical protein
MAEAAFWNNQERAREVVQRTKGLRVWIEPSTSFGTACRAPSRWTHCWKPILIPT